jgi:CRISPR-associated protein Cmr6
MPIAAVPAYLGTDFNEASPGLRFGMYLKLWGINRRTNDLLWQTYDEGYEVRGPQQEERLVRYENKGPALGDSTRLSARDKAVMEALTARQSAYADAIAPEQRLRLDARAVAPFTTGLGNEHPLENGFAFLNPYGLPYLPGSGVKGVLRQAARELASGAWGDRRGWSEELGIPLMQGDGERRRTVLDRKTKAPVRLSPIDVLFGRESPSGETTHVRGALCFWDVIPQIEGDCLMVEIMTPHQSHYYQQRTERKAGDSASPHDSGQPNPISFLTVPPGSGFTFHVVCDVEHLKRIAPDLAEPDPATQEPRWKALVTAAFEHAFAWLGFGAKTAVGYGVMRRDEKAEAEAEARARVAAAEAEREARREALSERMRQVDDYIDAMTQRVEQLKGRKEPPNAKAHNEARALARAGLDAGGKARGGQGHRGMAAESRRSH